jgi:co-chaperonin GroES (HSP10)
MNQAKVNEAWNEVINGQQGYNKSGLKPLGRAVLVQPYEPEKKASLIELPETVKERTVMVEQRAVVIEAGPAAWEDESEPRAKPGDKVLITKYAGHMCEGTADGKLYRLVNDRDVFCRIGVET